MSNVTYHFAPSMRGGLTTAIHGPAAETRVKLHVRMTHSGQRIDAEPADVATVDRELELYGPGDILGFNLKIVVRTDPLHQRGDFEPNFFPLIEFADPDFLWRFTANHAAEDGRLLPWITLIVLVSGQGENDPAREFVDEIPRPGLPQWITVSDPSTSLPELTEAWRWAHVQAVSGEGAIDLAATARATPDLVLCRLVCPRRLRPSTRYSAFVVPAFELGRCVGLELTAQEGTDAQKLAWESGGSDSLPLPYYFRWNFGTGLRRDFERLVRLLEPREHIEGLGKRRMDCAEPGYGVPGVAIAGTQSGEEHSLGLEGAFNGFAQVPDPEAIVGPAAQGVDGWLQKVDATPEFPRPPDSLTTDLKQATLGALHPGETVCRRVRSRLRLKLDVPIQIDPLDQVMWEPEFPQPMYEPLRKISQDLLFPGVDKVPQNTVLLLATNRPFIEPHMMGLNHEFAGELLWREYPTDQRGSYFRQFWDVQEYVTISEDPPKEIPESHNNLRPLHLWKDKAPGSNQSEYRELGSNQPASTKPESMALLIRGDLLKEYPFTVIYAVKAVDEYVAGGVAGQRKVPAMAEYLKCGSEVWEAGCDAAIKKVVAENPPLLPMLRGDLPPDLTFFGFELTRAEAEEYFFIFEEPVSKIRFGLNMPNPEGKVELADWPDLAWDHFEDPGGRLDGWYLDNLSPIRTGGRALEPDWWREGADPTSAQIAWATMQLPVRIAIKATMLLPDE
jgi:hypothetical protein